MKLPEIKSGYVKADSLTSIPYAYAEFELCKDKTFRVVLTDDELRQHADRSKGSLWNTNYEDMAKATARKALMDKYAGAISAWFDVKNGKYDYDFNKSNEYFIEVNK